MVLSTKGVLGTEKNVMHKTKTVTALMNYAAWNSLTAPKSMRITAVEERHIL